VRFFLGHESDFSNRTKERTKLLIPKIIRKREKDKKSQLLLETESKQGSQKYICLPSRPLNAIFQGGRRGFAVAEKKKKFSGTGVQGGTAKSAKRASRNDMIYSRH